MKVSEIKSEDIIAYCKIESDDLTDAEKDNFAILLSVAKNFIVNYTGLKIEELDNYEDLYIVVMILVESMHDDRTLYVDKTNLNKIVTTILNLHSTNLL